MDSFFDVLIPGFLGGLLVALAIVLASRRGRNWSISAADAAFGRQPLSTDVINMAHIRVAGVGGLGLVAMAAVVAWNVPSIGRPVAIAAVLGVVCAVVLVLWRKRKGPLPSSAAHPGANTMLAIDDVPERKSK